MHPDGHHLAPPVERRAREDFERKLWHKRSKVQIRCWGVFMDRWSTSSPAVVERTFRLLARSSLEA